MPWRHPLAFQDDRLHVMPPEPGADARRVISAVASQTCDLVAQSFSSAVDPNRVYDRFKRR